MFGGFEDLEFASFSEPTPLQIGLSRQPALCQIGTTTAMSASSVATLAMGLCGPPHGAGRARRSRLNTGALSAIRWCPGRPVVSCIAQVVIR